MFLRSVGRVLRRLADVLDPLPVASEVLRRCRHAEMVEVLSFGAGSLYECVECGVRVNAPKEGW